MQPPIYPKLELKQITHSDLYTAYFRDKIGLSALQYATEKMEQHTVLDWDIVYISAQGICLIDIDSQNQQFLEHDAIYDYLERHTQEDVDADWYDQWIEAIDLDRHASIEQAYWQEFYLHQYCQKQGYEYLKRFSKISK